jgi:hypothetical protein
MMDDTTFPVFRHTTQEAWGRAVVASDLADRRELLFEDGKRRTFKKDAAMIASVPLDEEARASLYAALLKRAAPAAAKKARKAAPKGALVETLTFEAQVESFRAAFPGGFADPKYLAEERGSSSDKGKEPALLLAGATLGNETLRARLAAGDFSGVHADVVRIAKMAVGMAHPQFEVRPLAAMPSEMHERFARALADLLYGSGDEATRFAALVDALGEGRQTWTLVTQVPALVHPTDWFFVKPKVTQRQARILGLGEPPSGMPTHEGYLAYRAVGQAVRDRLRAVGLSPRDLLDVHAFVARTLAAAPPPKRVAPPSVSEDD